MQIADYLLSCYLYEMDACNLNKIVRSVWLFSNDVETFDIDNLFIITFELLGLNKNIELSRQRAVSKHLGYVHYLTVGLQTEVDDVFRVYFYSQIWMLSNDEKMVSSYKKRLEFKVLPICRSQWVLCTNWVTWTIMGNFHTLIW